MIFYRICKHCDAGLSVKDIKLKYELPTREEYLSAIDQISEWHINNVPTYQKGISTELLSDYIGDEEYIKEYEQNVPNMIYKFKLSDKRTKYNVISTNSDCSKINAFDKENSYITKANENAIMNYKSDYKNKINN